MALPSSRYFILLFVICTAVFVTKAQGRPFTKADLFMAVAESFGDNGKCCTSTAAMKELNSPHKFHGQVTKTEDILIQGWSL